MKIFTAAQTRAWDAFTIAHEPIASIDLMERAATRCADWLMGHYGAERSMHIFCGKGNNGGDGLAIARLLLAEGRHASVYILETGKLGSDDFQHNLQRLHAYTSDLHFLQEGCAYPTLPADAVLVDALFGTGLGKPLAGEAARLVDWLNEQTAPVVSIDLPSGLFADAPSDPGHVVRATHTLTFEAPKLAQLLQENGALVGALHVLPIGLSAEYAAQTDTPFSLVTEMQVRRLYRPRSRFAHKGSFGHALLAAGSYGKMGAALMAAEACLRGGVGLLSSLAPRCGVNILQTALPEAMIVPGAAEELLAPPAPETERYAAIGIGPGIGTAPETAALLRALIASARVPLVLDADALNLLAQEPALLEGLPAGSVLTPHPKEFDRLFGAHHSDFARIDTARAQAQRLGAVVLLKGHHTFIATPDGRGCFNSTGNAGMAKGGSGDVLTGLLTALLAQGYPPADAAVLGVWLHGAAGDCAAERFGMESMLPTDLVKELGGAFAALH